MENTIIKIIITMLFFFVMSNIGLKAQECEPLKVSFEAGEELHYDVYYNWRFVWIPAGEAKFSLTEEGDDYVAEVKGANYVSYEKLFRVRDRFQSRFDKSTLRPSSFLRTIEEGNYRRFDSLTFDRELMLVNKLQGKSKEIAEWTEDVISPCEFDLISIMYYLRTIDLEQHKKGDKIETDIYFDDKSYSIRIEIGKRKIKNIKTLGKVKTVEIIPQLIKGTVFDEEDQMKIWVSDDGNKIPLLIESPIKVGSVKVILKSAIGTKYVANY